jgi:FkbM family methyltransferase
MLKEKLKFLKQRLYWPSIIILFFSNWFSIYYGKYILKKKGVILKLRNKYKFKVFDRDAMLPTVVEVWVQKVYGKLDFLKQIDRPIIVDIGANIGCFSLYAWSKNQRAKIFAVEPEANNFSILKDNVHINHADLNISCLNFALSGDGGLQKLYLDKETNSGKNSFFGHGRYMEVESLSLEHLFTYAKIDYCDLLKIDIEGGEYDVLYKSNDEIFHKISNIILEWHIIPSVDSPDELKRFLEGKGFSVLVKNELIIANKR